jgi:hypothetical protein
MRIRDMRPVVPVLTGLIVALACTSVQPLPSALPTLAPTQVPSTTAATAIATPEPTPAILAHYDVVLPAGTIDVVAGWTNIVALEARRQSPYRRIHVADTPDLRWRVVYETDAQINSISGRDRIFTFIEVRPARTGAGSEHVVMLLDTYAGNTRELDRSLLSEQASHAAAHERHRPRALSNGGFVAWTKWREGADGTITWEVYDLPAHIPGARPRPGPKEDVPIVLLYPDPVTYLTRSGNVDKVTAYGSTGFRATVIEAPWVEAVVWAGGPIAAVADQPGAATRIVKASFGPGTHTDLERAATGQRCSDLRGDGSWASWTCGGWIDRLEAWNAQLARKVFVANVPSPLFFEARHNLFFWTQERSGQLTAHIAHQMQP